MNKYLLTVCLSALILPATVNAAPTQIDDEMIYSRDTSFDGLNIGPKANAKFCTVDESGNCITSETKLNFDVQNDILMTGGNAKWMSAIVTQNSPARSQGIVLKNGANMSLTDTKINSNSRLELNSGSTLTIGAGSAISVTGDTSDVTPGLPIPGEVIIKDSTLYVTAGQTDEQTEVTHDTTTALTSETITNNPDGTTTKVVTETTKIVTSVEKRGNDYFKIVTKTEPSGAVTITTTKFGFDDSLLYTNSILTAENATINMSNAEAKVTVETKTETITVTTTTVTDADGNESVSTETKKTSESDSIGGASEIEVPIYSRISVTDDINLTNSSVRATTIESTNGNVNVKETSMTGGTVSAAKNMNIDNANKTISNIKLIAGNDMNISTRADNIQATAGNNMTIKGNYVKAIMTAGNDMIINADMSGPSKLEAGNTIDYQTGTGELNYLSAKKTTVEKPVNLTLIYGEGGGDIIALGSLTFNGFNLIHGDTNNVTVNNSSLNVYTNNTVAGNLDLNNSTMNLHKSENKDGWIKVENMTAQNSSLDLSSAYIESSGNVTLDNTKVAVTIIGDPLDDASTYGHIKADTIDIKNGSTLNITMDTGTNLTTGQTLTYDMFNGAVTGNFASVSQNSRYNFVDNHDGTFSVTQTASPGELAGSQSGNREISDMADAWLAGGFQQGTPSYEMADHLNKLSQTPGREKDFADALETLAPTMTPYITALAADTTRQLYHVIGTRFDRDSYRGRYRRNVMPSNSLWAQGFGGKGSYEGDHYFDSKNRGGAIGFDVDPCNGCRLGIGYAYVQSDIEALNRDADVDSHGVILYADFQGDPVYMNIMGTYMRSMYDEKKDVIGITAKSDYDVDVFSAQAMIGYDLGSARISKNYRTGSLMPEIGARYLLVKQRGYTDTAGQHVGNADATTVTGVAAVHYTADYKLGSVVIYPDLRGAVTYDFVQDDWENIVHLPNNRSYRITAERLDELGFEAGIEIGMRIANRFDIALSYLGMFRKDYTDHTGLLNLKYRF